MEFLDTFMDFSWDFHRISMIIPMVGRLSGSQVARLAIRQASHGREEGTSNAAAIRSLMM